MRFMIIVKATKESEAGVMPPESMFKTMADYHEELMKAGVLLDASGLHPSNKAWRIKYQGGKKSVVDGPFAETKELIAGFWLMQARDWNEITEWVKRAPFDGGAELEIRQVFEAEDFGENFTPELREQERRIYEQASKNAGK